MSRPPTGFRPVPTASGPRPLYSRGGQVSSYGAAPGGPSVALATQVRVADRPVTREGMKAARPGTSVPGTAMPPGTASGSRRVVYDQTFFLNEIRARVSGISREIEGLRAEDEQIQRDNASFAHFQRRNEALAADVVRLRDELADANMVIEKARLREAPAIVESECAEQRARNEDLRRQVDELFTSRVAKEEKRAQIMARIESHDQRLENMMQDPGRRSLYWALRQESERLVAEIAARQQEVAAVHEQTENLCVRLGRVAQIDDERRALEGRIRELEAPQGGPEVSGSAAGSIGSANSAAGGPSGDSATSEKEMLLQRVKDENRRVQALQTEIGELREALDTYEATSMSTSAASPEKARDKKEDDEMAAKLREVQARDAEMTQFLDSVGNLMAEERDKTAQYHETIVGLLEHMARTQALEHQLPSTDQHAAMKEDLAFKTTQAGYAATTADKLESELDARKRELEKMLSLDDKIDREVKALRERMASMNADLQRFSEAAAVAKQMEADAKALSEKRDVLSKNRDALRQRVAQLSADVESRRRILGNNPAHVALEALEGRIRYAAQNVHSLQEFVSQKGEEINVAPRRMRVVQTASDVNARIVAAQTMSISTY